MKPAKKFSLISLEILVKLCKVYIIIYNSKGNPRELPSDLFTCSARNTRGFYRGSPRLRTSYAWRPAIIRRIGYSVQVASLAFACGLIGVAMALTEVQPHVTVNKIGAGAYGSVEEVAVPGAICAAKKIHDLFLNAAQVPRFAIDKAQIQFAREYQLMSTLRYPNILKFLGVCSPALTELQLSNLRLTVTTIGAGAYGSVMKVVVPGAICAAKKIHDFFLNAAQVPRSAIDKAQTQFVREYQLMSTLRHPNIVQFLGVCFQPGAIVMERLLTKEEEEGSEQPNTKWSLMIKCVTIHFTLFKPMNDLWLAVLMARRLSQNEFFHKSL